MSNEIQASGSLRIPLLFDEVKEGLSKFRKDTKGLFKFVLPGLNKAFNLGAKVAQLEFDIWQDKEVPIPDSLKLNLKPIVATFMVGYNEALAVFNIRATARKRVLGVNKVKATTDILLDQYRTEFDNAIKKGIRLMFNDSYRQGHAQMTKFIGPVK